MKLLFFFPILFLLSVSCHAFLNPPYPLTVDQLKSGEYQLEKLLENRPLMKEYIKKGDDLWFWTVRQFAGEWAKGGVDWDNGDPNPLWDSMCYNTTPNRKAYIQVTQFFTQGNLKGVRKTGPALWCNVIYELNNMRRWPANVQLNEMAKQGKIDKETFVYNRIYNECKTPKEFRDFIFKFWFPHCRKLSKPPTDKTTVAFYGFNFSGYASDKFDNLYDKNSYHYKDFENFYNSFLVPSMNKNWIATPTPGGFSKTPVVP